MTIRAGEIDAEKKILQKTEGNTDKPEGIYECGSLTGDCRKTKTATDGCGGSGNGNAEFARVPDKTS